MTISYVQVGAPTQANSSPQSPAIPTGTQKDDVMLLVCLQSSAAGITFTPPAGGGWTSIGRNSNATRAMTLEVFMKRAVGSDSAPSVACSTPLSGWCAQIITYRDANRSLVDAAAVTSDAAAALTWQPTGITTATDYAWFLSVVGSKDDNALNHSVANGFTLRMSGATYDGTAGNGSDYSVGVADKEIASHGAETSPTWQQTVNGSDAWVGLALALRPSVDIVCTPTTHDFVLTGYAPTVFASLNQVVTPSTLELVVTGYVPTVNVSSFGEAHWRNTSQRAYTTGNTSITLDKPTGTVDDDILIAAFMTNAYMGTITPPDGWSEYTGIAEDYWGQPGSGRLRVYWKRASGEGSSWTWSWTNSVGTSGGVSSYYGIVLSGDPNDCAPSEAKGYDNAPTAPSITTLTDNALLVMLGCVWLGSYVWSPPGGFTERGDVDTMGMAEAPRSPAGAGSEIASLTGNDYWVTALIALKPEPGAPGNITLTPATLAMALSLYAPIVASPRLVTPSTLNLALAGYIPNVQTPRIVVPSTLGLALNGYAPIVATPRLVTPSTLDFVITGYVPTITIASATQNVEVIPDTLNLVLTGYVPTVTSPRLVTPTTLNLVVTGYVPTVFASNRQIVTPTTLNMSLAGYAPVVATPRVVTPPTKTFALTGYAPAVFASDRKVVVPTTLNLVLAGYAPTITSPQVIIPGTKTFVLQGYAPTIDIVFVGSNVIVTPPPLELDLTGYAPAISAHQILTPATRNFVLTGYAPQVASPRLVMPDVCNLVLTGYEPDVLIGTYNRTVIPGTLEMVLSTYPPIIQVLDRKAIVPPPWEPHLLGHAPQILTPITVTPTPLYMTLEGYAPILVDPPIDVFAYDNGAIRTLLIQNVMVQNLTQGRVYADELPESEAKFMPRKAIVINSAGGTPLGDLPVGYRIKDIRCYAESPYEASRLWAAVNLVFKNLTRELVTPMGLADEPVLIYSAARASGPIMLREPDTTWPLVFGTYQVLIADEV